MVSARWLERADKGSDEGQTASVTNDAILQMSERSPLELPREENGSEKPEMRARGKKVLTAQTKDRQTPAERSGKVLLLRSAPLRLFLPPLPPPPHSKMLAGPVLVTMATKAGEEPGRWGSLT